ncbi:hypothetical protein R6Q59_016387 [Mikania micrantha]
MSIRGSFSRSGATQVGSGAVQVGFGAVQVGSGDRARRGAFNGCTTCDKRAGCVEAAGRVATDERLEVDGKRRWLCGWRLWTRDLGWERRELWGKIKGYKREPLLFFPFRLLPDLNDSDVNKQPLRLPN